MTVATENIDGLFSSRRDSHPVHIYTLGRFAVELNGHEYTCVDKLASKSLDLIKALVSLGGRGIGSQRLAESLWPDLEADAAQHALSVTLSRVRKQLGGNGALLQQAGRISLNPDYCWVDVWVCERLFNTLDLQRAQADEDLESLLALHAELMALYHGAFLDLENQHSYMVSLRERLRSRLQQHLLDLGRRLGHAGRCQESIQVYASGIRVHEDAEDLFRQLMICNAALGQRDQSLKAYDSCKAALHARGRSELGPQTEQLYDALCAGDLSAVKQTCQMCVSRNHGRSQFLS